MRKYNPINSNTHFTTSMATKREKVYLFLDTNLHLHFQDFDQVDWSEHLNCRNVCLVFAPVVVSELEKHKYDRDSQRKQKRARSITKKINDIILASAPSTEALVRGRKKITALMLTDSPDLSQYPGLQQGIGDDELVASILKFALENQNISRDDIVLVSDDGGVLNKARARGIQIHLINDALRLPDEPTIDQEKISRLERKIKELEDRQPKLKLSFLSGESLEDFLEFTLKIPPDPDVQYFQNLLDAERKAIAWAQSKPPVSKSLGVEPGVNSASVLDVLRKAEAEFSASMLAASMSNAISQSEIDRYQKDTEKYLQEYQSYLRNVIDYEKFNHLVKPIVLLVSNIGNVPATGVIVRVTFPEELNIFDWDEFPDRPEKPEKPVKPRGQMELLLEHKDFYIPAFSHFDDFSTSREFGSVDPDTLGPKITRNSPAVAEWTRTKVLHQVPLTLTTLGVVFPDQTVEREYDLRYKIFAENLPLPAEGSLHIQIHAVKER